MLHPSYAFCPTCGRATVALRSSSGAPPVVFGASNRNASLPLVVRGQQPLVVSVRVETCAPLRFQARGALLDQFSANVPRPASLAPITVPFALRWQSETPPPVDEPLQIPVFLSTGDGAPRDGFDIEPGNRTRVWEPLYLLVSAPRPAKLEIETAVLVLGGRARGRVLSLHNSGETALVLRPPLWPAGFEIEAKEKGPGEWTLPPGARKKWMVRASPSARSGETVVALANERGETLGQLSLFVPAVTGLATRTRYVIGVDFGTSGTSIWKRDGRDDRLEAQPLCDPFAVAGREDARRFPSVLYVSFRGGYESSFSIGYEAVRKRTEDSSPGLWVRELKTLLRAEGEPYVAEFGPNYRVDLLLKRYLEKLRSQIILPELEGGETASVAWNFSLPVLDSHRGGAQTLFNLQKSRLEKAIRAAHFLGTNDVLEFFTEPFCAAIYLLLQHGHYRYPQFDPPRDGDWACIFDSGGGTTDVVLGQVRLQEGQLRFEEVATLGGYRSAASSGTEPAVSTFGGEALTRTTAIYLSVWENARGQCYDLLRYEAKNEEVYRSLKAVAQLAPGNEDVFLQREVQLRGETIHNPWTTFDAPWEKIEGFKRQFAAAGAPGSRVELQFPALVAGEAPHRVLIVRSEFDQVVVNRRLDAIGTEMKARIFPDNGEGPSPVEVKWVFGVGGNCRVRRVGDWLQEFFPGGVQELSVVNGDALDESDRMLAVAGGAVWASKASQDNTLPYALRVEDELGATIFEASDHAPLASVKSEAKIYVLRFEQSVKFQLFIAGKVPGDGQNARFEGVAGGFSVANLDSGAENSEHEVPSRAVTVKIALEGRRMVASSDESGAMQEVFSYSF